MVNTLGDQISFGSDHIISLIAFNGYGAHRTIPIDTQKDGSVYVNDVSFLRKYDVRKGYKRYGAIAYFDTDHNVTKITIFTNAVKSRELSEMKVRDDEKDNLLASSFGLQPLDVTKDDGVVWIHAKWVWKVSLSVATFLKDYVGILRFREVNAFVTAINTAFKFIYIYH